MGFFNNYLRLRDMANEMDEKSDVAGDLASMQSKLDALNAAMAQPVAPVVPTPAAAPQPAK